MNSMGFTLKISLFLVFILLEISNFIRIDQNSHSASDALINFIPQTAFLYLIFLTLYYIIKDKKNLK